GWLAALTANPRRRRTVIVVATAGFILFCQLPNLLNVFQPWKKQPADSAAVLLAAEREALQRSLATRQIPPAQAHAHLIALARECQERVEERQQQLLERVVQTGRLLNLALPPGWLPLGASEAAEGNLWPALAGTLGLGLIGATSLWRGYRTTLRLYT